MSLFEKNVNISSHETKNAAMKDEIKKVVADMLLGESYDKLTSKSISMPEIMGFVHENYTDEKLLGYIDVVVKELKMRKFAELQGLTDESLKDLVTSTIKEKSEAIRMNIETKANDERNQRYNSDQK